MNKFKYVCKECGTVVSPHTCLHHWQIDIPDGGKKCEHISVPKTNSDPVWDKENNCFSYPKGERQFIPINHEVLDQLLEAELYEAVPVPLRTFEGLRRKCR